MRAWRVHRYGGLDCLKLEQVDDPPLAPDEVRVAVAYAAVNFADGLMIRGTYQVQPALPFSPGFEVSGHVIEAGPSSGFGIADRVCGQVPWGGYAERVVAPSTSWMRVPDEVGLEAAAAVPVSYVTAHLALFDRGGLGPDDDLVVLAASGGVGRAALELAADRRGTTVAVVGGAGKMEAARRAGATHVIDHRTEDWERRVSELTDGVGADVVLDPVGGNRSIEAIRALAWRGRLLLVGFASGGPGKPTRQPSAR